MSQHRFPVKICTDKSIHEKLNVDFVACFTLDMVKYTGDSCFCDLLAGKKVLKLLSAETAVGGRVRSSLNEDIEEWVSS